MIKEAIGAVAMLRIVLDKFGFQKDKDPWVLRKLYGLDHDGAVPLGFRRVFEAWSQLATCPREDAPPLSLDKLKNEALAMLDAEIKRLERLRLSQSVEDMHRERYERIAALVPPQEVLDRLLCHEAHLSREFDRTLSQLERLQRMRLGQAVLPPGDSRFQDEVGMDIQF